MIQRFKMTFKDMLKSDQISTKIYSFQDFCVSTIRSILKMATRKALAYIKLFNSHEKQKKV